MPTSRMETAHIAELLAPYLDAEELPLAHLGQMSQFTRPAAEVECAHEPDVGAGSGRDCDATFWRIAVCGAALFPMAACVGVASRRRIGRRVSGTSDRDGTTVGSGHADRGPRQEVGVPQGNACDPRRCGMSTVLAGRAETCEQRFDVVTFRAVEHFGAILPISAGLVEEGGKLAALIGSSQVKAMKSLTKDGWAIRGRYLLS